MAFVQWSTCNFFDGYSNVVISVGIAALTSEEEWTPDNLFDFTSCSVAHEYSTTTTNQLSTKITDELT